MGPTRIVINGRFLTQGITGVQRYQHELLHAFDHIAAQRDDLQFELVAPRGNYPRPPLERIGFRQHGRLTGHAWEQLELPRVAKGAVLFCGGNSAPLATALSGNKLVVTVHDLSYRYFPEAYSAAYRWWYEAITPVLMRRADAIVTVSNSEKSSMLYLYPDSVDRLHAVQNGGLPITHAGPLPETEIEGEYLLYVGSLSRRKNFPNLLRAAIRLVSHRDLKFIFVGGTDAALEAVEVDVPRAIRDRIVMLGQVNDTQRLIGLYSGARAFVFPSSYEASPLPPIEAMACGLPVICSDIPSLRERCGEAAHYCDANDVEGIQRAVELVLDDKQLADDLRNRGFVQAAQFDWLNCATKTLKIIEQVAS